MPVTVSLQDLSWSTPDGTPLFTNITLRFGPERVGLVGRNGSGKSTLLALIAGALSPSRGRVICDGTCAFLRQDVQSQAGDTIADLFGVRDALDDLAKAAQGQADIDTLANADWSLEERLSAALSRVGLSAAPDTALTTLSGGERTCAGLAALMFGAPDILLLDEPTNHLDGDGRARVIDLLARWPGPAIIASHDRTLLNRMDAIVELTALGATRYGGNYDTYRAQKDAEMTAAQADLDEADKALAETRRRALLAAERKARKDSAGRKSRGTGSQPKVLLDARKDRSEATGAAHARQRDARQAAAVAARDQARARVEILEPFAIDLPATSVPAGKTLLRVAAVSGGYDDSAPVLRDVSLTLTGPERVAIAGPNGAGKSTLIALISGQLKPLHGTIEVAVPFVVLDQNVGFLRPDLSIRDNYLAMNRAADENSCRAALVRFMFRADDALQKVGSLSGGQRLRAGLACVLGCPAPPQLLILDEPNNHLDLEATKTLETALAGYNGAILVVSHDQGFLQNIGVDRKISLTLADPEIGS